MQKKKKKPSMLDLLQLSVNIGPPTTIAQARLTFPLKPLSLPLAIGCRSKRPRTYATSPPNSLVMIFFN